jgi:hypothetical protein
VAARAVYGAPYRAVIGVLVWLAAEWSWVDGEAALMGINLLELPANRFVHAAAAAAARSASMTHEQRTARDNLSTQIDGLGQPKNPSLDDWGYGGDLSEIPSSTMKKG